MTAVGIEVGRAALDVGVDGVSGVVRYANTAVGIGKRAHRLQGIADPRVVVEATGGYETLDRPSARPTSSSSMPCPAPRGLAAVSQRAAARFTLRTPSYGKRRKK